MMEAPDLWHLLDRTVRRWLDGTRLGRVHVQGLMRAKLVIIPKVAGQDTPQMLFPRHNDLIETCAADTPNEALHVRILPRTPRGDHDLVDAHVMHPLPNDRAVNAITVPEEVAWRVISGERLDHLLGGPRCCGVLGDVAVHDAPALMSQDHEHEEDPERHGRDGEEIQGD